MARKSGSNGEEYLDTILPQASDFSPITRTIDDCTEEDLKQLALSLLTNSHHFCNQFVPSQLQMILSQISVVNQRINRAGSADDYVKLTATMRNLVSTYSQLLEQSTVVYMSSYRPITTLLQKMVSANKPTDTVDEDVITGVDISNEIDTTGLQDDYGKYTD